MQTLKVDRVSIPTDASIIGEKVWLDYFDQNSRFEEAFVPQYCTVLDRFAQTGGADDWFLVKLDLAFEYEGSTYEHLLIRSRWVNGVIGNDDPTSVFIVLVPEADDFPSQLELDGSLFVAWGLASKNKTHLDRYRGN